MAMQHAESQDGPPLGADIFVARQPIFSRRQGVYGYELLFCDGMENAFRGGDGSAATVSVIETGFLSIGLQQLTGGKLAFINFTRELLLADEVLRLPCREAVIEILEDIEPDEEVVEACAELRRRGFTLALDDYVFHAGYDPLLELAGIIKFEFPAVRAIGQREFEERVRGLRLHGVELLAEKVETREEFEDAVERGFHLFQGYFWGRPEILTGKKIEASAAARLQLLNAVHGRGMDVGYVKDVIKADPALSLSLLRYINSGLFRWMSRIESLHRAVVLLGPDEIRRWVAFMAVTTAIGSDRPKELIVASVTRARFCELLAPSFGLRAQALDLFFTGLFSQADAMFGLPLAQALEHIPLPAESEEALLRGSGRFAGVLALAIAYEQGDWPAFAKRARSLGLDENEAPRRYLEAVEWANELANAAL